MRPVADRGVGDFGGQGELPDHPELLDRLAVEFMRNGWNTRPTKTRVNGAAGFTSTGSGCFSTRNCSPSTCPTASELMPSRNRTTTQRVKDIVHVRDLHATMLHLLGIDHARFTVEYQGLDTKLTGVEPAKPVKALLV